MRSLNANGQARLDSWRHVREFAVPASMIDVATARRLTGDWAGACAAAHVDVDLDLRALASTHGREFAALIRTDLQRLAPDLLRWHLPRTITDGLLRPGLTISLARYPGPARNTDLVPGSAWSAQVVPGSAWDMHLVVRTAPTWADAGQRLSLALWDPAEGDSGPHPRPRPDPRFRLDLHQHLWAADRAHELRERSGFTSWQRFTRATRVDDDWTALALAEPTVGMPPGPAFSTPLRAGLGTLAGAGSAALAEQGFAVHRWVAEAAILRAAEGHAGPVAVRLGGGRRLLVSVDGHVQRARRNRGGKGEPVLPYAATWIPPDLELLHTGLISADRLHPLVAEALAPALPQSSGRAPRNSGSSDRTSQISGIARPRKDDGNGSGRIWWDGGMRLVECGGETHRLGLVDGRLVPLDHEPEELRREEMLAVFGGPPLPCLRAIGGAARNPDCLDEIRTRLDHGDHAGATALVTELLGPGAQPEGELRAAFEDAAEGLIEHGLYRAGLSGRVAARSAVLPSTHSDRTGPAGWRGRRYRRPKWGVAVH